MSSRKLMFAAIAASLFATATQAADAPIVVRGAEIVGGPVQPIVISQRSLPAPRDWQPGDPLKEIPLYEPKGAQRPDPEPRPNVGDPLVANQQFGGTGGGVNFDTPLINIAGSLFSGVNPSDTVGDVGIDHYVQMINNSTSSRVRIFNKSDGSLATTFLLNSLAAGLGTTCGTQGQGDPTVNFDETVDNGPTADPGRWVLTEFTDNSFCVYISQTADPTAGTWFLYEFASATGGLPDYPKFAVWPDAYYVGANEGPRAYALDRERMLLGQTARPAQAFVVPQMGSSFQFVMPVDWDGELAPPAAAPGLFLRHRDTEGFGPAGLPTSDILEVWEFRVNWTTPASSTLTGPSNVTMAEFDSNFCNFVFSGCLAQPTGTTLFALWQPVMWRAQYRNFGTHQSIVANLSTDVIGNDVSGVRWFELRKPAAVWTMFQEGTIAPDATSRFMGSAAMDETGNIAVGYNVVSTSVFPGMRYTGRLLADPPGTMPRGEVTIQAGLASNGSNRYGDYSALAVDPVDGCTFWYTAQHNPVSQWTTRVAAFRFDACGAPGFYLSAPERELDLCTASGNAPYSFTLDVGQISGFTSPVALSVDPAAPAGISTTFGANPVAPPNATTLSGSVSSSVAAGDYLLNVRGVSAPAPQRDIGLGLSVFTAVPPTVVLATPADDATNIGFLPTLTWAAVAQVQDYVLEISTSPTFATILYTRTVTGTTHVVQTALASNTEYFWRVRARNTCGPATDSAVFSFTTQPAPGDCPIGVTPAVAFFDGAENGEGGWTHSGTGDTWAISTQRANSGVSSWKAVDPATVSDQRLVSPAITLPSAAELPIALKFATWQQIETNGANCWDSAILEISTNNGTTWTQITNANLLTLPYDGTTSQSQNPLAGLPGWCSSGRGFVNSVVALDSFAGQTVRFRFRLGSDTSVGGEGMYVDDFTVQSCPTGPAPSIFANGFE